MKSKAPVKAPVKAVKAPVKAVKAPVKSAKAPVKSVKAPAKSAKAPAKSVKAPAKSVKAPVKSAKAPAKAVKAVRKYRKGGMPNKVSVLTIPLLSTGSVNRRKKLGDLKVPPWLSAQNTGTNILHATSATPSIAYHHHLPSATPALYKQSVHKGKGELELDAIRIGYIGLYLNYKDNDNGNFISDAKALLNKLKLINGEDDIEEKKEELSNYKRDKGWRKDFIYDIYMLFIMPHTENYDIDKVIFKKDTVLRANTNYTDIYIKARRIEMEAEDNAVSAEIRRAGEAARQAKERQIEDNSVGIVATRARGLTGWEAPHPSLFNHYSHYR